MNKIINKSIVDHITTIHSLDVSKIELMAKSTLEVVKNGNKVFWCGNGGSASQANHLSAELVGGMYKNKIKPFKSVCLNTDTAFITAWSNDDSFENIFSRQLQSLAQPGDLLIAISTSGNSKNIINAAKYCNDNNIKIISLTGFDGGILKNLSDININIATNSTQRVQEMHILVGHILCDVVEHSF
jgi:D-sedoheptulose 7-phosphate isomerase